MGTEYYRPVNAAADAVKVQQKKKRTRRLVFYIVLAAVLAFGFIAVSVTTFFKIKTVNVTGTGKYSAEEILREANIKPGDNIFFFSAGKIEDGLKEKFPFLSGARIVRDYPDCVNITLTDEVPAGCVEAFGKYYLISQSLRVLEMTDKCPENIRLISAPPADFCIVGKEIIFADSRAASTLKKLLLALKSADIIDEVTRIDMTDRYYIKFRYGEFDVNMGNIKDAEIKTSFLARIVKEKLAGKKGSIDISDTREAIFSEKR